ncbi:COG1361 S-layer family protein [Candidatus Aenigmatarchaeota archaeon]
MNYKLTIFIMILLLITPVAFAEPKLEASLINHFPDPARVGDIVELRINVENAGDEEARNIMAELQPRFPFSLVPDEEAIQTINLLPSYPIEASSKTLIYRILVHPDAPEGLHDVKFRVSDNNGQTWTVFDLTIDLTTKDFAQIIYIDKTQISPGKEIDVVFTISNIGKAPLSNLVFSWTEEEDVVLPVSTDNTRYIRLLTPDESIDLKYTVVANPAAERGLYNLDLKLTFDTKDESGATVEEEITTKAGVLVGGETDFDIAFSETDKGKTSLSIANIGENDATSVTVRIPEQTGFTVNGGSSSIIGNLNTGDFTLATFKIKPIEPVGIGETRELLAEVDYTSSFGERHTLQKSIPLKISPGFGEESLVESSRASPLNDFLTFIIIVIIIIILYKKRKSLPFSKKKKRV